MQEKIIYLCRDGKAGTSTAYGRLGNEQYALAFEIQDFIKNGQWEMIHRKEQELVAAVANTMILVEEYGKEKAYEIKAQPEKFKTEIMGLADLYQKYNYPLEHVSIAWVKENVK